MEQQTFLPPGTEFRRRAYEPYGPSWDHDHCEFCGAKFALPGVQPDAQSIGFTTTDKHERGAGYYWVCCGCFDDFQVEFNWSICV